MGQRSQIYVKHNGKLIIANYYRWNYGERMISRARWGIEALKEYSRYIGTGNTKLQLSRIFDVNFDMHDVAISTDIFEEYQESVTDGTEEEKNVIFYNQDNNDGQLIIDVCDEENEVRVKYAFVEFMDAAEPMNGIEYMDWDFTNWKEYLSEDDKKTVYENIAAIDSMATLMTKKEAEKFFWTTL